MARFSYVVDHCIPGGGAILKKRSFGYPGHRHVFARVRLESLSVQMGTTVAPML
jgi:hypothetical protein